jgi:hypothetical protein
METGEDPEVDPLVALLLQVVPEVWLAQVQFGRLSVPTQAPEDVELHPCVQSSAYAWSQQSVPAVLSTSNTPKATNNNSIRNFFIVILLLEN